MMFIVTHLHMTTDDWHMIYKKVLEHYEC